MYFSFCLNYILSSMTKKDGITKLVIRLVSFLKRKKRISFIFKLLIKIWLEYLNSILSTIRVNTSIIELRCCWRINYLITVVNIWIGINSLKLKIMNFENSRNECWNFRGHKWGGSIEQLEEIVWHLSLLHPIIGMSLSVLGQAKPIPPLILYFIIITIFFSFFTLFETLFFLF